MHYMLMFYQPATEFAGRDGTGVPANRGAWTAYVEAVYQAGIVKSGDGLQPPASATTVRIRGDRRQVQDGPFADSKEQLAGYFVIDVPDLDVALEWAARAPCASTGGVEVRPVLSVVKAVAA